MASCTSRAAAAAARVLAATAATPAAAAAAAVVVVAVPRARGRPNLNSTVDIGTFGGSGKMERERSLSAQRSKRQGDKRHATDCDRGGFTICVSCIVGVGVGGVGVGGGGGGVGGGANQKGRRPACSFYCEVRKRRSRRMTKGSRNLPDRLLVNPELRSQFRVHANHPFSQIQPIACVLLNSGMFCCDSNLDSAVPTATADTRTRDHARRSKHLGKSPWIPSQWTSRTATPPRTQSTFSTASPIPVSPGRGAVSKWFISTWMRALLITRHSSRLPLLVRL